MTNKNDLPYELRTLVRRAVALLGQVIRRELGDKAYQRIEHIRRTMAASRGRPSDAVQAALMATLKLLRDLTTEERFYIAHSFALMLELMNACENAYRTYRLGQRPRARPARRPKAIIYVLTAHPTEARSPVNIAVFHEIQRALIDALVGGFEAEEERLRHLLEVAWRLLTARRRKPRVEDEAEHIYSILLRDETLRTLLTAARDLAPIYIRTWVGGDKDGHPGVDQRTMLKSLQLSRTRILAFMRRGLKEIRSSLKLVRVVDLDRQCRAIEHALKALRPLYSGDGRRVRRLRRAVRALAESYANVIGATHPALAHLMQLIRMFPGLVVPLELRESSDLVMKAAAGKPAAITRMMDTLAAVAAGGDPLWYACGFIISMAGEWAHIEAAGRIVRRSLGGLKIPIIPLFEQKAALDQAPALTVRMLDDPSMRAAVDRYWNGYLEVMMGYSDSAKEVGVLASRLAIAESMRRLDRLCRQRRVTPLFFHGSGGSVDRGGGSVQEQTAWWPRSALGLYKATVQGEMVERSLASPEITRGQLEKISQSAEGDPGRSHPSHSPAAVRDFAERVSREYTTKVSSPAFMAIIQHATAYRYLSVLRIGSRPSERAQITSVSSLRAIPWVLCWTQTRVLFPTWWGVGTAWRSLSRRERAALARAYAADDLFRSYVKALGFTLAKVELPVWRVYLEHSGLDTSVVATTLQDFEQEYRRAVAFVRALSGSRNLLWFRPWLGTSIRLRSPMIHPLNLLQIVALEEDNPVLIRETVTGIASGMLTTG